jgi:hypothetical protein
MSDKAKKKPVIDFYRYIMVLILIFVIFSFFDLLDGDPDGLRGLATFIGLMTGGSK